MNAESAHQRLRNSEKGKELIKLAEANAASMMFDLASGDLNADAANALTPNTIYDAVMLCSSLDINVDGKDYSLEPYYAEIRSDDDLAMEMMHDISEYIAGALLDAALMDEETPSTAPEKDVQGACMAEDLRCLLEAIKARDDAIRALLNDVVPHVRDTGHNAADREMDQAIKKARSALEQGADQLKSYSERLSSL